MGHRPRLDIKLATKKSLKENIGEKSLLPWIDKDSLETIKSTIHI